MSSLLVCLSVYLFLHLFRATQPYWVGITAYYLAHLLGLKLGAVGIYLLLIGCAALYVIATFKVSQLKFPSRAAAPERAARRC